MENIPSWKAHSHSGTQEIPRLLRNTNVHYLVHKSSSLGSSYCKCICLTPFHRICLNPF